MKKLLAAALLMAAAWTASVAIRRRARPPASQSEVSAEAPGSRSFKSQSLREIEAQIAEWPEASRRAAQRMIQKYGLPDQAAARVLIWNDNGPWKRTIVRRDAGKDVLEQIASYHVPNDRYDVIGHLQGNVSAERGRDELSSKAPDEPLNFLSLNLADEVISGRRDAENAGAFYKKTAALTASGKSSPYTESLLFAPPATSTGPVPGAKP